MNKNSPVNPSNSLKEETTMETLKIDLISVMMYRVTGGQLVRSMTKLASIRL
jgi:hypothetical protein